MKTMAENGSYYTDHASEKGPMGGRYEVAATSDRHVVYRWRAKKFIDARACRAIRARILYRFNHQVTADVHR
jgi:hypothetical protein